MKKFRNFVAEEMSVTLKQHGSTSYKVHSVGSKMKSHGGLKVGETVHDHHIDDLRDSGIKVRYHKEEVEVDEAIERKADSKMIMVKDPNTGKTVLKKAPRKEIEIGKGRMESVGEKYNPHISMPNIGGKEYKKNLKKSVEKTTAHLKPSKNPGLYRNGKRVDEKEISEISDKMKVNYINKANKAITDREKLHLKIGAKVDKDKTLEKMRKGVALAKSKLGEAEYSNKEVRMGKGVAFDKRYKGGNMTGAYKTINKIKKGLGDHPKVRDALRQANEEFNKGE
jgi:hypothetical protein